MLRWSQRSCPVWGCLWEGLCLCPVQQLALEPSLYLYYHVQVVHHPFPSAGPLHLVPWQNR